MNRRSAVRTLMSAGAGSLFGSGLFAGPPQDDQDGLIIHSETRLVLLDVSVRDVSGTHGDGHFVSGLSKENFSVFENGRPQQIAVFDHGDPPVTVGILVDESRSMSSKRAAVITAALTFISESNPQDEIFVLNFNDSVVPGLLSPMLFSDDIQELRAALFRGVSEGRTVLNDAVVAGLAQLELGKRDKKTLVLISDGGDNASRHTRREMLGRVESSIATIYTIGLFDEDDADRDPGILRQLAAISGGEAYFPASPAEMIPTCHRIARDIRSRYTLGYVPAAGKSANDIRNIRVGASARGHAKLIARTRSSYRYDQIDSQKRK
jgi:Ca-activated chloride channel family protein